MTKEEAAVAAWKKQLARDTLTLKECAQQVQRAVPTSDLGADHLYKVGTRVQELVTELRTMCRALQEKPLATGPDPVFYGGKEVSL